ncbi:MAG TPA: hypothetical protein VMU37_01470 [Caulobacteraceae bacterium]|nr:hypothetical protein [Caulobacteraceae bacterium]
MCARSERVQGFLREDAARFVEKRYASVFILPDPEDPTRVLGYYSLSPGSVAKADLINRHDRSKYTEKGIPVPIALIGYMGRADYAPQGLGGVLLVDAAIRLETGKGPLKAWGIGLEPENEGLVPWYAKMGFVMPKNPREKPFMYGHISDFLPPPEQD